MDGNVAAVAVTVDKRVHVPSLFFGTDAATSDHFVHRRLHRRATETGRTDDDLGLFSEMYF